MSRHSLGRYIFIYRLQSGHLIYIIVDILLAMYLCRYLSRYLGRYLGRYPGHQEGVMLGVLRWCLTLTRAQHSITVSLLH